MAEWKEYELNQICSRLSSGKGLPAKKISNNGKHPVYGGNGLRGYTETANFEGDCAIIGRQGAYCGNVRYFSGTAYMTEHAVVACANEDNNTRYLSYLLSTMNLGRLSGQSAQPGLSVKTLGKQVVKVPPLATQNKAVSILAALDTKIEDNEKINKNLLQQIEALFKERFLSHDALPFGWKRRTLGEVSEMSAGGDKPKTISDQKTDACQYPVYSNGISDEGLYGFTTDYKISSESVTVSARGTIGFVCLRHIPYTPIVRLVTLVPRESIISAKYLYLWLKSIPIHGTGTTQQQLTVPDFRKTEIIIPPEADMRGFTETVNPLFHQVWSNQDENAKLADVRDALLPRLMSGELDVSDLDL